MKKVTWFLLALTVGAFVAEAADAGHFFGRFRERRAARISVRSCR